MLPDQRQLNQSLSDSAAVAKAKAKGVTRDALKSDRVTKHAVTFTETADGKLETRIIDRDPAKPVLRRLLQMTEAQRVAEREIGQEISIRTTPAEYVREPDGRVVLTPQASIERKVRKGALIRPFIRWGRAGRIPTTERKWFECGHYSELGASCCPWGCA